MDEILRNKGEEVSRSKREFPLESLLKKIDSSPSVKALGPALTGKDRISIIAEVKRASPSKGMIREDFDPAEIAKIYEENGADAISVLTEESFFQGKPEYLTEVKRVATLPVLRKDFIIDEYQIYESRILGADAILLIVAALSDAQLRDFLGLAEELGMDCLMEVHDRRELERALSVGANIIGINNRDLKTFKADLTRTLDLLPHIPEGKVVVSESGIHDLKGVLDLRRRGVDAVLVGEVLMRAGDIGNKLRELLGFGAVSPCWPKNP